MIKFTIPYRLPGLNDYTKENRRNKYGGNKLKQETEEGIIWILKSVKTQIDKPVRIKFTWYEQTKRRDKDNVAFAKKFILDALQKSGILKNDNNQFILGFEDDFVYRQGNKVVIEIWEGVNDDNS